MENIYQALGRGLRQTAGDLEGAQTQMDKGQEMRLTLQKMIQERAYAIEAQRKIEMENELAKFNNERGMDQAKRQDEHRQQIRMQREKAQAQAQIEAQKAQQSQALEAQKTQAAQQAESGSPSPSEVPGWAAAPQPMQQASPPATPPPAPPPSPSQPGPTQDDVYGMADDLYGSNAIEGKDWLDFQTKYAKASGKLQDPEMQKLKRETERARALAQQALANLRNRTDPNKRGGGKGGPAADALAQVLAADDADIAALEIQLEEMGKAPSQYGSDAMGYRLQYQAVQAQLRAAQARMIRNAMKAQSADVLPPSMGGAGKGAQPVPGRGKKYKYVPGQGVVPK